VAAASLTVGSGARGADASPRGVPAGLAPNTWSPLAALPERLNDPLFALAVDPFEYQRVLAGTPTGNLYRSSDGGGTWKLAGPRLGRGVLTVAFDPFRPGVALAGTRAGGIWRSRDGGASWQPDAGSAQRTVRAFGFARQLTVAGTDAGLLVSHDAGQWTPAGLGQVAVSAVAVAAVTDPLRLVAGGDTTRGTEPLPLFDSRDGGQSWQVVDGAVGGSSMVSSLTAGPSVGGSRPLLMGTNTGLYSSADQGVDWQAITGSGALPSTDYTGLAYAATDPYRFYVASDGGASPQGGLWSTADGGTQFRSLSPPVASVSSLAVSGDQQPLVYVATFRPIDHAVMLWAYWDTGGAARQPPGGVPSPAVSRAAPSAQPTQAQRGGVSWLVALVRGPEAPYLALGLLAAMVLALAAVAYARRTSSL
jgi:photosystem II stability/assembly factor-like uncharacterized protein